MIVQIERLDHHGRGIAHLDGKIVFIDNALPDEKVKIKITKESSKYYEAKVTEYVKLSDKRVKSKCIYYESCGGCHLRHMDYNGTIDFKIKKVKEIFEKYAGLIIDPEVIECPKENHYRNKVEIKVVNNVVGFYEKGSHNIVELDRCLNAEDAINALLLNIDLFHLKNGEITIKSNYNGELIIVINTDETPDIEIEKLREKHKIVGILVNNKLIFGSDNFIEVIDGLFFKETYNSFFQTNRQINEKLFSIIKENINYDDVVLDLCCGVGTLSIVASTKAKNVYGIEIVENSVKDAIINAKMNKRDNVEFILGDAFEKINIVKQDITKLIVDPPRSGLNEKALRTILSSSFKSIIYVACDPVTMSRDLKVLSQKYEIKKSYILDMFPYTYHVECVSLLSLKNLEK